MKLYKYVFDVDSYESITGAVVSHALRVKYRHPLYTTNLYPPSNIRARYGDEFVDVEEMEIEEDWIPVDWTLINKVEPQ